MTNVTQADRDAAIDLDELHIIQVWNIDRVASAFAAHRQSAAEKALTDGAAEERAKIVAWLRYEAVPGHTMDLHDADDLANAIEAGEHLK